MIKHIMTDEEITAYAMERAILGVFGERSKGEDGSVLYSDEELIQLCKDNNEDELYNLVYRRFEGWGGEALLEEIRVEAAWFEHLIKLGRDVLRSRIHAHGRI